jgi:hypothetical protein
LQPGLHYGMMHTVCSSLRGTVSLQAVLSDAEALFAYAGDVGLSCLKEVPLPGPAPLGEERCPAAKREQSAGAADVMDSCSVQSPQAC